MARNNYLRESASRQQEALPENPFEDRFASLAAADFLRYANR